MGKISKATNVSKALVNKGISKSVDNPKSSTDEIQPRLQNFSSLIADEPVSRGKRKRAVKRARIESRNAFVEAAIKSKKATSDKQGLGCALGDFVEMNEVVDQELAPIAIVSPVSAKEKKPKRKMGALKRSEKQRSDAVDLERFNKLMCIPDFASNPMAAMEKHLLNLKRKKEEKEQAKIQMEVS